jgi:SAM-dependent methyltransferase
VRLFRENGCNPERIFDAQGENLPFPDGEFEIVYSTNCLEHTLDPMKMLSECLRVLKPGGVMQIVYPNYHGYFDGHYGVFHPPIFIRGMFVWYLEKILGRTDTEFAKTLRTELNMFWTRRAVRELRKDFEFEVLSIGEEVFLERMKSASLDAWAALRKCRPVLDAARKLGLNAFAGRLACLLQGQMPIILTIKKTR